MTALTPTGVTLVDHAKLFGPDGNILPCAEVLNQTNVILRDAYVMEGNLPTGHRHGIRTGLPSGTFRKYYGFVQPTKSTRVTVDDTCAMLEAYSDMDKAIAQLGGRPEMVRNDEDRAHIEGMGAAGCDRDLLRRLDPQPGANDRPTAPLQFHERGERRADRSRRRVDKSDLDLGRDLGTGRLFPRLSERIAGRIAGQRSWRNDRARYRWRKPAGSCRSIAPTSSGISA